MLSRIFHICLVSMLLVACSTAQKSGPTPSKGRFPGDDELPKGSQGVSRKVGNPYQVAGQWYYPKEQPGYDETGIASWYGQDFHGKPTANGEYFNMNALTAAHKTLPLPTFVKVTNLENGRSLVLRVNDRGPFVGNRIIDISRRGAQLLGFDKQGTVRVRVQAVDEHGIPEKELAQPQSQPMLADAGAQPQLPQYDLVETDTLDAPSVTSPGTSVPAPTFRSPTVQTHYIQIGAYTQQQSAENLAQRLTKSGHRAHVAMIKTDTTTFWRVRVGPFVEKPVAEERLTRIVAQGFKEARIFSEAAK